MYSYSLVIAKSLRNLSSNSCFFSNNLKLLMNPVLSPVTALITNGMYGGMPTPANTVEATEVIVSAIFNYAD
jgi:hypothetical protein